jgi:putative ATP-dependent endonuclease of the OLD family
MKLSRVHIQNFRGIQDLTLDLDDTIVLIGENNTGKTSILHAIRLCLRDLGPRRRVVFDTFDLHLKDQSTDPSNAAPISITLTFSEDTTGDWDTARLRRLKDILHVDGSSGLSRVVLRVTCSFDESERDLAQTWDFLDEAGQPLPGRSEAQLAALQREVAFYMLDALRDAGRNFDARGPFWRPFLRQSQLEPSKKQEIQAKLEEVNELIVGSHGSFDQARDRLKKVQDLVPMQPGDVVSIEAVPGRIFDMLTKAQVHLATTTGAKVPVGRHGEGTQSLAVLMLFAAFLDLDAAGSGKNRSPVVALEEPEAHLHPSAVRALWKTVEMIPGQKLVSTHSGDLLSQVPVRAVRRLARSNGGISTFRLGPGTLDAKSERMFDFHIRHARGELLFARCWLLGEGETEVTLFNEIARHLGIDFERAGVRCVPYRLGASIELFLKVGTALGIRWCVVTDNDQQGQADQNQVKTWSAAADLPKVLHAIPEDNIEAHLCSAGFGPVYEAYLTQQLRTRVTVPSSHPDYWTQVLQAIKNVRGYKPAAALEVVQRIQAGSPVPPLLETAIRGAFALAEAV